MAQTANQGTIEVDDILFVTPKGDVRHFAPLSIDLVNKVQSSKFHVNDSQSPVYDLAGRRVSKTLKKGIYITNGMKKLKVEE